MAQMDLQYGNKDDRHVGLMTADDRMAIRNLIIDFNMRFWSKFYAREFNSSTSYDMAVQTVELRVFIGGNAIQRIGRAVETPAWLAEYMGDVDIPDTRDAARMAIYSHEAYIREAYLHNKGTVTEATEATETE